MALDYNSISEKLGKIVTISLGGLTVKVKILNYKNSYGSDRWLVTPMAGTGEIWVENFKETDD